MDDRRAKMHLLTQYIFTGGGGITFKGWGRDDSIHKIYSCFPVKYTSPETRNEDPDPVVSGDFWPAGSGP